MRVSKEQAAENRARILAEAARMIREAGITGVFNRIQRRIRSLKLQRDRKVFFGDVCVDVKGSRRNDEKAQQSSEQAPKHDTTDPIHRLYDCQLLFIKLPKKTRGFVRRVERSSKEERDEK